jgi:hypothetical protein
MYFSSLKFCKSVTFVPHVSFRANEPLNNLALWRRTSTDAGVRQQQPARVTRPSGSERARVADLRHSGIPTGSMAPVGTQPPAAVELRHAGKCGALRRASARQWWSSGEQVRRRAVGRLEEDAEAREVGCSEFFPFLCDL